MQLIKIIKFQELKNPFMNYFSTYIVLTEILFYKFPRITYKGDGNSIPVLIH